MEGGEGMVAVVRGMKHSGLAVTLLDGNKQYTLIPAGEKGTMQPDLMQNVASQQTSQESELPSRCESSAQATDGRYTSVYKLAHCRMSPTSPPVELTEFPPQRVELCRGRGNFEVGGCGSGESYSPCKSNGSFRGGLCWSDRGAVCSARSCREREPDAFAKSLRKYPNMTMDRSSEMIEKLINYTQAKNISKSYQNRYPSPSRQEAENSYNQVITDRCPTRNVQRAAGYQKIEEQDMKLPNNGRNRMDESPIREVRSRNAGDFERTDYRRQRSPESKYAKEVSRKLRESVNSLSYCPYSQPARPTVNERYQTQTYSEKDSSILTTTNSVNMEVQAAAEMVSKGVATVPRIQPLQRSVAVSLSPAISSTNQKCQGEVSVQVAALELIDKSYKYVQTANNCQYLSVQVQATSSSVELAKSTDNNCIAIERKSKSEDKLTVRKELGDEIMELLERVSACPTANPMATDLRRKVLKRMSAKLQKLSHNLDKSDDGEKTKIKIGKMLKYVPVWIPCGNVEAYRDTISNEILGKIRHFNSINEVYRAEVAPHQIGAENSLNDIIRNWLQNLPIKTFSLGKLMDKNQIIDKYTNRIQRVILNKLNDERIDELHADLLSLTAKIPMNVNYGHKIIYLNQVIPSLIIKIGKFIDGKSMMLQNNTSYIGNNKLIDDRLKKYVQPTENELRGLIEDELSSFFRKLHFPIDVPSIKYVETELIDIIMESMQAIRLGKDNDVMEETVMLLQEISGVTENQAEKFAITLLAHIKEVFSIKDTSICLSINAQSQNYMVLQNAPLCSTQQNRSHNMNNNEQRSVGEPAQSEKVEKFNVYLDQLTQQIDEWLQFSQIDVPHSHDKGFRNIVIQDLAGDIIDRHKYLDLNPSRQESNEDELKLLKYQIFKWINKLVGEENKETLERAPELMKRIQSIPRPTVSKQHNNGQAVSKGRGMQDCSQLENYNDSLRRNSNRSSSQMPSTNIHESKLNLRESFSQSVPQPDNLQLPCCSATPTQHSGPSMRLINDEYDNYLKNWVKEIPMPSSTPEELAMAEKARQGIYNGVWQIITKLKFDPAIFHNVFYYEDAFDEELEELFKCLPETTELKTKKHLLKVKLIEKTTNTNEMIKNSSAPSSFRQQLVENVAQNLPISNKSVYKTNDSDQTFENEQIQKIVDDYVLCAKFKESNQLKADVYRKKLIQKAQSLIENIKNTNGKQLKEIDTDLYINSILSALHKVPLPNAEILDDEANEIQVGQEVDQWFADLQCVRKNDPAEHQQTSKLKNALVKRIIELDKDLNISNCSGERALKHEVSLFLERMPKHSESANIDFMAEEFTNRLKNRFKEFQTGNEERKSVAFLDSVGYYEFSVQMPACSSFSEMPLRPALFDQSSLMIRDGSIVPKDSPRYLQYGPPPRGSSFEIPSNEYVTIEDSRAPKKPPPAKPPASQQNQQIEQFGAHPNAILPGKQLNSCCQSANNGRPLSGAQHQQATEGLPPINQLSFQNQAPMYSMVRDNQLVQGTPHSMPQMSGQAIHDQRNSQEVIAPVHRSYHENGITNMPYGARNEQQMVSSIPNEIPPCCGNNNQGFEEANRVVSPTLQRPNAAYAPICFGPEVNVSQKIPNAINPKNEQSMMANVPAQVPPYYARNGQVQETSRVVSPTRQRPDAAYAPACFEPEVIVSQRIPNAIDPRNEQSIMANKAAQIPPCYARYGQVQETSRVVSPTRQTHSASIAPPYSEPISNGSQRIPIVVKESELPLPQEANRSPHQGHCSREQIHQQQQQQQQQQQEITGNRNLHGNMTTYGQPQGFSTPQSQVITEIPPRRPDKKKSRRQWRGQQNFARRRLDLEDDTDDASESEGPCHCMTRTFKYRRGPSCYDYEDFELDGSECYPYPFSCPHFYFSAFLRNDFTSNICGYVMDKVVSQLVKDGKTSEFTMRKFKSVQTSFSSSDLISTEKYNDSKRKIKSQEDIRSNKGTYYELIDWIRDAYSDKVSAKFWNCRMQKLIQKLAKPGGEAEIRKKIERFLNRVPSALSECSEEQNEFRKQLPDTIIKKLNKMYLKTDKRKSSSIRIFRVEIPKSSSSESNRSDVTTVIKSWFNKVPIKKKDSLNRFIKKEDVLDFVMTQLEPYMRNINALNNKSTVQLFVRNLLEEIPIETNGLDKTTYLNQIATYLVYDLYETDGIHNTLVQNNHTYVNKLKMLKHFVAKEVANIYDKAFKSISTKRLQLLENELYAILKDVIILKNNMKSEVKKSVYNVLIKIGSFHGYQANYLTDSIITHLEKDFNDCEILCTDNKEKTYSKICETDPEIYSVAKEMGREANNPSNNDIYHRQVKLHIKTWLKELSTRAPLFPNKDCKEQAVTSLAEDIIDRIKYLELNPASKGTFEQELQYLKYQIFKWINKVVGAYNLQTIEDAPALMKKIQSITIPSVRDDDDCSNLETSSFNQKEFKDFPSFFGTSYKCYQLHEQTVKWLIETTGNTKNFAVVSKMAQELSQKIYYETMKGQFVVDVIEKEVNEWFQKVFIGDNIEKSSVDTLKKSLSYILFKDDDFFNVDHKQERYYVRMFEDTIDEWLDTFFDTDDNLLYIGNRNECIHDLAVTLLSTKFMFRRSSVSNTNIEMKRVIFKWLQTVMIPLGIEVNITDLCINKLVQDILTNKLDDYNEEVRRKQKQCSKMRHALKRWLMSLLLYKNANVNEKRRLVQVVNNLTIALTDDNFNPLTEIHKYIQIIMHPNRDYNIIKQNADNLKTYLRELNLYKDRSNDEEYYESKLHRGKTFISSDDSWTQSHVTVYGFNLPSNSNKKVDNSANNGMRSKAETVIEADVLYAKRLIVEIDEWLNGLQIPQVHDKGFREVVVNDLAGDIIDRHKYLELNPESRGTDDSELEQLRYQIFKWINKLVGHEHTETLQHAPDLMNRIQSIPVPVLINSSVSLTKTEATQIHAASSHSQERLKNGNDTVNNAEKSTNRRLSITGPMATTSKPNVNPISTFSPKGPGGSMTEQRRVVQDKRLSGPAALGIPSTPMRNEASSNILVGDIDKIPQGMSLPEVYAYFDKIIKERIQEIPLQSATPDQEQLANLARTGMYNAIWKAYHVFLNEPEISNDYCLFDLLFEERIDDMLDCLPQTEDMLQMRPGWKSKLLNDLLLMLKYVHSLTDLPITDVYLKKMNRQMFRNMITETCDKRQHCFVARTAEAYIISTRYKEEDPIRANVYRQRLMKRLEELIETIKFQNKAYFHQIESSQLCKIALDILKSVPIPNQEELKEEAEEILLGEEIEEWYKDLPVRPVISSDNECLRKRLREILAKRLRSVEKQIDVFGDPSLELERNMKHEISRYLEKDAELKVVNDLNINFMVEELANRIKIRREHYLLGYEGFEKDKPTSSSFVQTNAGEVMAPLVNIQKNVELGNRGASLPSKGIFVSDNSGQRFSLPTAGLTPCCQHQGDPTNKQMAGSSQTNAFTNHDIPPATHPQSSSYDLLLPPTSQEYTSRRLSYDSEAVGMTGAWEPNGNDILEGNVTPCIQHPNIVEENQVEQLIPGNMFQGQNTQSPSTEFVTNTSSTGAVRSTARVATNPLIETEPPLDEEMENEEEGRVRFKCNCMERLRRRHRRYYYCNEYMAGYPRSCYPPDPFPMCYYH